ncbi:EAL domain-containing protein [Photobacterium phosphoreum]|uniref:EAL domain-containing protein n=1 Tax=Photobacterium phosphoreum TaxID=659 RepID=UPI0015E77416|nr:EAL domain-containing protein [Photobacterium phosphoreum]
MYQPKYHNDLLFGYEALLRSDNNGGLVCPHLILDKNSGDNKFDYFIINSVIDSLSKISDKEVIDKVISINVSARFMSTIIILSNINIDTISELNLHIEFEILEGDKIINFNICNENINLLKRIGISVSVDDFGSDYSSIRRLINLKNVNFIKLDRILVRDIENHPELIKSIQILFEFIWSMNFNIIAEGVEKEATLTLLKSIGIEYFQGFYFSKPLRLENEVYPLEFADVEVWKDDFLESNL